MEAMMKRTLGALFCIILTVFCISSCGHEHEFAPATCTAPKTCSVCNQTEGKALGHTYSDATCTTPKTCSVCNQTEGKALGHTYSDGICAICCNEDPVCAEKYDEANRLIESGKYASAYDIFKELGNYKDSKSQLEHFKYVPTKIQYDEYWYGGAQTVFSQYTIDFSYNQQNLLSQHILTSPDGGKAIYVYSYDLQGNLIQSVTTYYDGDKVYYYYTYDNNGNLIKEVSEWYDGDKYITDYTYDENGLLIKAIDEGGTTSSYTYDAYENLIKQINTTINGSKFILDHSYDKDGNLIKTVLTQPSGNKVTHDYTYDSKGNLIKSVRTLLNGDKNICDYTYDENNNLIKEVCTTASGERFNANIEYMFVYIQYDLTEETENLLDPTNYYFGLYR